MMEQYLMGKLSPAGESMAEAMQHRRIGYGPRFPGQERKAAEAKRAAAAKKAKAASQPESELKQKPAEEQAAVNQ